MVYDADKEWVAFDQGKIKFEATALKAKRGESVRRKSNNNVSSNQSVESWMKRPVATDSSWMPVAPPSKAMQSPAKVTHHSRVLSRRASSGTSATNPVSSDSSSSSERHSMRNRGRNSDVILASPGVDVIPDRSHRSHRSRSRSTRRSQTAPIPPGNPSKGKSSRGRSSSRSRTVQPSPARRRSLSQQRQPSPAPKGRTDGRGRSSSRTRTSSTKDTRTRSSSRARSSSRTPNVAARRRSRSNSRTPSVQPRARSTSRPRPSRHDSTSQISISQHSSNGALLPVRQGSAADVSQRSSMRSRGGPPPCTSRTRREMTTVMRGSTSASSVGPGLPPRHSPTTRPCDDQSVHTVDPNLGRDITFGATAHPCSPTTSQGQNGKNKRSAIMEKLFGNPVDRPGGSNIPHLDRGESIHPRILLTATVYHNTATNLWITTINTNQKGVAKNPTTASKYLKAFSFASEREARESAIANAPPKMLPFTENPICFLCKGKFAVFRRAGHCRNCGVCVCNNCSTNWPSRMIPDTYNLKKESTVKICKSCDALSKSFKKSLLTGNYEDAIALYGTGNINLRTPFPVAAKKDEIMYPIHCAVEGGNTNVVRWLMDDHFCPIKLIRTGSGKRAKRGMTGTDVPILTSKGRSVMTIAMDGLKIDILRYLVIERDVSVYEAKDLKSSLRALEAALQAMPPLSPPPREESTNFARWDDQSFSEGGDAGSISSSFDEEEQDSIQDVSVENKSKSSKRSNKNGEACIICYDNSIDCVMTPCGHQVCCLNCSSNLSACPVCNNKGEFIKIFRP